jgi:hypothetical protein
MTYEISDILSAAGFEYLRKVYERYNIDPETGSG